MLLMMTTRWWPATRWNCGQVQLRFRPTTTRLVRKSRAAATPPNNFCPVLYIVDTRTLYIKNFYYIIQPLFLFLFLYFPYLYLYFYTYTYPYNDYSNPYTQSNVNFEKKNYAKENNAEKNYAEKNYAAFTRR